MKVTIENEGATVVEIECDHVLMSTYGDDESERKIVEMGRASNRERMDALGELTAHMLVSILTGTKVHFEGLEEQGLKSIKRDLDDPDAIQELIREFKKEGGGLDA